MRLPSRERSCFVDKFEPTESSEVSRGQAARCRPRRPRPSLNPVVADARQEVGPAATSGDHYPGLPMKMNHAGSGKRHTRGQAGCRRRKRLLSGKVKKIDPGTRQVAFVAPGACGTDESRKRRPHGRLPAAASGVGRRKARSSKSPHSAASRRVRVCEYPIMSTAKCASLADDTIVGEPLRSGKGFGYHPRCSA